MAIFFMSHIFGDVLLLIAMMGVMIALGWAEKARQPGEHYTCIIVVGIRAFILFIVAIGLLCWDTIVKELFLGVMGYGNVMHWLGSLILLGIIGTEFIMAAVFVAPSRKPLITFIVMVITILYYMEIDIPESGSFAERETILYTILYTVAAGFVCHAILATIHGIYLKARRSEKKDTSLWDISASFKRVFSGKMNVALWLRVFADFALSFEGYGFLSWLSIDAFLGILAGAGGGIVIFLITRMVYLQKKLLRDEWDQKHFSRTDKLTRIEENLTMKDGTVLQGFIYKSTTSPGEKESREKKSGPAILFFHGFGGFAQDLNFEPMLSSFAMAGYTVFAYDYRWSGHSRKTGQSGPLQGVLKEGISLFEKMIDDAPVALDWVISHKDIVDPARIATVGFSLGSLIAFSRGMFLDPRVKLIVAGCSMHDLGEMLVGKILKGAWYMRLIGLFLALAIKRNTKITLQGFLDRAKRISPSTTLRESAPGLPPNDQRVFLAHCKDDNFMEIESTFMKNKAALNLPDANCIVFETGSHYFKNNELALGSWVLYQLRHRL